MNKAVTLLEKLERQRSLSLCEYEQLILSFSPSLAALAAEKADAIRREVYGNSVYIRGLIEVGNICKNDCLYCGIRKSNTACERYRLTKEDILACCEEGYPLGFRTFVMQGGEDPYWSDDRVCDILRAIKERFPDCAVTLSLGERSKESYQRLFDAGADRYLLRHETADSDHYSRLHPPELTLDTRMRCLMDLRQIGFQVGCGMMVGSPYQTSRTLARDLKFIESFRPDMCGIGPFIPHSATPFADKAAGSVELSCFLVSLVRLIHPAVLLPSTTALGTIDPHGREKGIQSGANVVMPNLSPLSVRKKYMLYDNKIATGTEAAEGLADLKERMHAIGYEIVTDRGDVKTHGKDDPYHGKV